MGFVWVHADSFLHSVASPLHCSVTILVAAIDVVVILLLPLTNVGRLRVAVLAWCYTEKATTARHRPERQHNARWPERHHNAQHVRVMMCPEANIIFTTQIRSCAGSGANFRTAKDLRNYFMTLPKGCSKLCILLDQNQSCTVHPKLSVRH